MKCTLDNLIFYVENVNTIAWERLTATLSDGELITKVVDGKLQGVIPLVRRTIGTGASQYHHNLHVGQGGGSVMVSWKHNSQSESQGSYRMRVEFNPSKRTMQHDWFWEQFKRIFHHNAKLINGFDLAFDVQEMISNISVVSLTGRDRSLFKNTVYYGSPGNTGRLKVYDKKKELKQKQGIEISEENLTRIEYSMKFDEPLNLNWFERVSDLGINKEYCISRFNLDKTGGVLKASVLAIQNGLMELKEFTRDYKVKIKKALKDMEQLDVDHAYMNAHEEIIKTMRDYIN